MVACNLDLKPAYKVTPASQEHHHTNETYAWYCSKNWLDFFFLNLSYLPLIYFTSWMAPTRLGDDTNTSSVSITKMVGSRVTTKYSTQVLPYSDYSLRKHLYSLMRYYTYRESKLEALPLLLQGNHPSLALPHADMDPTAAGRPGQAATCHSSDRRPAFQGCECWPLTTHSKSSVRIQGLG